MKKKLHYALLMVCLLSVFYGCKESDNGLVDPDSPNYTVRFKSGDSSFSVSEGATSEVLKLDVFTDYVSDRPIVVKYDLEGDLGAFRILNNTPGEVVIPANEDTGSLLLSPIDNDAFSEEPVALKITITGADDPKFGTPVDRPEGYTIKTLFATEDDCPPSDRVDFNGSLSVEDVGYSTYGGTSRLGVACDELIIAANLPNSSAGLTPDFVFKFIPSGNDDGKGTVTCAKQPYGSNFYEGQGTYDNGVMTVDYKYTRASGSTIWPGQNIIKLN